MYQPEQVLVPVDFSSFSRCAVAFARQLGAIQLVHAVGEMSASMREVLFPYAALGEDDRELEAEVVEIARRKLEDYFEIDDDLRECFAGEPVLEFGAAKERFPQSAGRFDADLIALGAFGESGVYSAGLGSTSRRIVSAASKPVALIRDYDPQVKVESILVVVDLGRESRKVLEVAMGLCAALGAELEVLHVIPSPFLDDTNWMVERGLAIDVEALEAELRLRAEALMEELVGSVEIPMAMQEQIDEAMQGWSIRFGDPAEEIGASVGERGVDLVVAGRGGAKRVGRVTSALMADVARHLVVVPA